MGRLQSPSNKMTTEQKIAAANARIKELANVALKNINKKINTSNN
jgi:hypothetical protein